MNPRYPVVAARAVHRCEYCRAPEVLFNFPFEVEHIDPRPSENREALENLALACRSCNLFKSNHLESVDDESGEVVRLFNPRRDEWGVHFRFDDQSGSVVGMTGIGRATSSRLQMNSPAQTAARLQWVRLGLYP